MQLGIISDIHEDITNLKTALGRLNELRVDEIVCLGDIVGYNVERLPFWQDRDAKACINLVKNSCTKVIPGNHDLFAIRKIPAYRGGFRFTKNWYDLDFYIRKQKGEDKVWLYEETELSALPGAAGKAYLDSLPETESLITKNGKLLFTHYIYPDVTGSEAGFAENREAFQEHLMWMKSKGFDLSFSGHGHIEGLAVADGKSYHEYDFNQVVKISMGSAVVCPAIARGKKTPGFIIFDTRSLKATAHPVEVGPSNISVVEQSL